MPHRPLNELRVNRVLRWSLGIIAALRIVLEESRRRLSMAYRGAHRGRWCHASTGTQLSLRITDDVFPFPDEDKSDRILPRRFRSGGHSATDGGLQGGQYGGSAGPAGQGSSPSPDPAPKCTMIPRLLLAHIGHLASSTASIWPHLSLVVILLAHLASLARAADGHEELTPSAILRLRYIARLRDFTFEDPQTGLSLAGPPMPDFCPGCLVRQAGRHKERRRGGNGGQDGELRSEPDLTPAALVVMGRVIDVHDEYPIRTLATSRPARVRQLRQELHRPTASFSQPPALKQS